MISRALKYWLLCLGWKNLLYCNFMEIFLSTLSITWFLSSYWCLICCTSTIKTWTKQSWNVSSIRKSKSPYWETLSTSCCKKGTSWQSNSRTSPESPHRQKSLSKNTSKTINKLTKKIRTAYQRSKSTKSLIFCLLKTTICPTCKKIKAKN